MSARKRAMAKPGRRTSTRGTRTASSREPAPSVAERLPKPRAGRIAGAKRKFERGILGRGEAAPRGRALPPGATHEIVAKDDRGRPVLKRKRFSAR